MLAHRGGLRTYLAAVRVLLVDFAAHALTAIELLKDGSLSLGRQIGRPVQYLTSDAQRRRSPAAADHVEHGLIRVLTAVEHVRDVAVNTAVVLRPRRSVRPRQSTGPPRRETNEMKFGLLSQIQVPKPWAEDTERNVYWQNLDHVVAAEHAGFSHFWLTEQHFFAEIGHSPCPEMFLAAASQRTHTIRLGFAVILMPCHNPFMIAERVATLDVLSNGRCEFGAGRGTAAYVVEGLGFNADAEVGREVGREALEAVVRMLEQEHFPGYKGEHFDLPARQVVPRPIQRPHPPLWFAASNLETFERAGAAGVGVLGVTRYTHAEIRPHVEAYRAAIATATPIGRFVNNHVGVFAIGCVHDDDRIGRDVGCAAARFYYGDNDAELNHVRFGSSEGVARIKARMAGYSNDDLLETGMAIGGNADSVCRQVERWAATGIDQMVFMFQIGRTTTIRSCGRSRSSARRSSRGS